MSTLTGRIFKTSTYNGVTRAHIYRGSNLNIIDLVTNVDLSEWTGPGKDHVWLDLQVDDNAAIVSAEVTA